MVVFLFLKFYFFFEVRIRFCKELSFDEFLLISYSKFLVIVIFDVSFFYNGFNIVRLLWYCFIVGESLCYRSLR